MISVIRARIKFDACSLRIEQSVNIFLKNLVKNLVVHENVHVACANSLTLGPLLLTWINFNPGIDK